MSFASCRPLGSWITDVKLRFEHLSEWTKDPSSTPKVVNLSRLFSPQSFLTAITEVCSQQHHLELNKLNVLTTVTKKDVASIDAAAREGQATSPNNAAAAFICGTRGMPYRPRSTNRSSIHQSGALQRSLYCKQAVIALW